MSIQTAPSTLSFTNPVTTEVTTFELVDLSATQATYRATQVSGNAPPSVYGAPTFVLTRRPASNGQTQRKYNFKLSFPTLDPISGLKVGEWIISMDSSRPVNWASTFLEPFPSAVTSTDVLHAFMAFANNDVFIDTIDSDSFVR